MILIILGHILGDFYVQTDKIATKKKTSFGYMLLHCFLYSIVMYIIMIILTQKQNISIEIPMTIEQADSEVQVSSSAENENVKIGSLIGILEREIILLLGLMVQYGAIGFVLTAKSLARYKQLEKKAFAEKYLVGTLLSALIAFGCVAMCSVIC